MRLLGAILAGGRSSRFGSDKAEARLGGASLLDHAISGLAPIVDAVAVCGREVPGRLCLADRPGPDMGPLGGLNAALHHAAGHGFDGVLLTACDMPVLPTALLRMLVGEGPAVIKGQHLLGYWPSRLADALDAHLAASGDRSIRGWLALSGPRVVPVEIEIPNINTRADLDALARGWKS